MVCERCGEHFEADDGFCLHCSEGCVHCRNEEPVLCEGFCVHCGREVLGGSAKLGGSGKSAGSNSSWATLQAGYQNVCDLTYSERLSVAWLLIWRGLIVAAALSFGTGLVVWITAFRGRTAIEGPGLTLILLPTLLLGVFVIMPWLVRTMVKKRFRGFSLVVLRGDKGSDT